MGGGQKFFSTKQEADDYHARGVVSRPNRTTVSAVPPGIPFAAYADRWIASMHEVKPGTARTYRSTIAIHLVPAFGEAPVRNITFTAVLAWATAKRQTCAKASVKLMFGVLGLILRRAVLDGLLSHNPVSDACRELGLRTKITATDDDETVKAFTVEQLGCFLVTAEATAPHYSPMWRTQALTGLRPGEVAGLHVADVLDEAGAVGTELRVRRTVTAGGRETGTPKTPTARRGVQLSPDLRSFLTVYLLANGLRATPDAIMFPAPRRPGYLPSSVVAGAFKRVVKAAGLPLHFTPHSLRHTYASIHIANGTDVYWLAKQLGHKDLRMTTSLYGAWLKPRPHPEALAVLDRLVANAKPTQTKTEAA